MANLLRSAKSGSDWTQNELRAYNIAVQWQDAVTFFGVDPLPQPAVAQEVLTTLDADDMILDDNYKLLRYMDLAMNPAPTEESAVDDFAVHLLKLLGYLPRSRMARTRADIPLWICGEQCHAETDVCIVDSDDILLLIEEDKRHKELKDPEPQLIAEAIAAFQMNNFRRERLLGQAPIASKVIPGITLIGSSPTFYKIPVTTELAEAVSLGEYPTPTVVFAHLPTVPRPARRWSEGMKPLDNRVHILRCYEAFKQFVNWYVSYGSCDLINLMTILEFRL
ncbi:hypothetical protein EV368DRAFT_44212 [Lentinula lateritia]|uniref:Uncharacterized protein n=1 Tax=Lentinula aff. lateritia TaxID=2804960 RepID=A0ACC1TTA2_9AGAR|nr:hypothetical protein F5876DRAFT_79177 [Lentinula aff. lateritia]KAJ3850938.1 hypothetical protein EV368DRAFT_44212 [Lentinula lateritia]